MNKKLISILLILLSLVVLSSCNSNDITEETEVTESKFVNVGSLKGATTIGLAKMIDTVEENGGFIPNNSDVEYDFKQFGLAEEVVNGLLKGETDLATIPANLASTLYNKSDGDIQVICINTLGVLYIVENGNNIQSIEDLNGETIYSIGKGITPEGVLNSFIKENNLTDINIEYKSEASEIAALLKMEKDIIAMIPEPFVSVVEKGNENVKRIFDMNKEWERINNGNSMVTGVLVGRREFIEENEDVLQTFLKEYEKSIQFAKVNFDETAEIVERMGIIPEGIGKYSIPNCNLDFIEGQDMTSLLRDYLTNLYKFNPDLIGGFLPKEDFYYNKNKS